MRLFLILPFLFVTSAYAADPPKMVDIPDPRDNSVYHVPADNPALIAAIRAKVSAKPMPATKAEAKNDGSALADLNAKRAARGLKPYIEDPALTQAAEAAAQYRASCGIAGHCNDFSFLPPNVRATCAGCAANEAQYGFMACEVFGSHTYCGAAWVLKGGRLFCHAFYR